MIEQLTTLEVQEFIKRHEHDDPSALMLQARKYPDLPFKEIVQQIQSRKKASQKLPEWHGKQGVIFPPPLSMEQCSSEVTARFKSSLVFGKTMADLTGGAGIDTYYLSQSFQECHYVEQNALLCAIAQHNFGLFSRPIAVHNLTAEAYLGALKSPLDFLYIDPARRGEGNSKVFLLEDCTPDIVSLQNILLNKAETVMIKTAPLLDIHHAENKLDHIQSIYIIAVANEVKEVLYVLHDRPTATPLIHAVNLSATNATFSFTREEENAADVSYSTPLKYIYEPNKAILKGGAFKLLCNRYGVEKLHPNSHLYTSDVLHEFPGRAFECLAAVPYKKQAILPYLADKKANITTRNFPDTVQTIKKKMGIQDGGETYLLATTNIEDRPVVLVCKKVGKPTF